MKKKRSAFWLAGVLAISSPAFGQTDQFTAEQRAAGEAKLRTAAKDIANTSREPASVTFRNVFLQKRIKSDGTQPVVLCGEVNGKNGYGGFTGFQPFILVGDRVSVGTMVEFSVAYLCKNNNPIIDTRDYTREITAEFKAATGS